MVSFSSWTNLVSQFQQITVIKHVKAAVSRGKPKDSHTQNHTARTMARVFNILEELGRNL